MYQEFAFIKLNEKSKKERMGDANKIQLFAKKCIKQIYFFEKKQSPLKFRNFKLMDILERCDKFVFDFIFDFIFVKFKIQNKHI